MQIKKYMYSQIKKYMYLGKILQREQKYLTVFQVATKEVTNG